MNTTTDKLPEYAVTIACCGDPQPVIDELTEWLDEQTTPQIMTPEGEVAFAGGGDADEDEPVENDLAEGGDADEDDPAEDDPEPAEGEEIDETSGGRG